MDNPLDAALGQAQPQPEPVAETPPEPTVPVEPAVPPAPEPDAGEPPALREGQVPLASLLDERDKRQKAEAKAKELEDWRQQQAQAQPLPPEQLLAAQRYDDNLRYSRKFAERQYGKALIDQVHQWAYERADRDPYFNAEMAAHDDPYEAAVQAYNREQVLQAVTPSDLDAFKAWKAAQAQAAGETPALRAQTPAPQALKPPPRSLAEASGTGALGASAINVGEGEAFASLFRK